MTKFQSFLHYLHYFGYFRLLNTRQVAGPDIHLAAILKKFVSAPDILIPVVIPRQHLLNKKSVSCR